MAVGAYFAVAVLAGLVLDNSAAVAVVCGAAVLLVAYCIARPSGGWGVFGAATLPPAVGTIAHEISGASRWWVLVAVMPIGLLAAWREDSAEAPGKPDDDLDEGEHTASTSSS